MTKRTWLFHFTMTDEAGQEFYCRHYVRALNISDALLAAQTHVEGLIEGLNHTYEITEIHLA